MKLTEEIIKKIDEAFHRGFGPDYIHRALLTQYPELTHKDVFTYMQSAEYLLQRKPAATDAEPLS